jgi:hypothetical protein
LLRAEERGVEKTGKDDFGDNKEEEVKEKEGKKIIWISW